MKKLKTKIAIVIIGLLLSAIILILIAYSMLPALLERYIIPEFAPGFGITNLTLSVDRADISGLTVSSLNISNKRQSGVRFKKVSLDLDGQTIKALKIKGVKLFANLNEGKLTIPGIKISNGPKIQSRHKGLLTIPSFISKHCIVSLTNSELQLNLNNKEKIVLPLKVTLKRNKNKIQFHITSAGIKVHSDELLVSIPFLEFNGTINYIKGKHANLDQGNSDTKPFYEIDGIAKIAQFSIKKDNFSMKNLTAEIPFKMQIKENGITWKTPQEQEIKGIARIEEIIVNREKIRNLKFKILQERGTFVIRSSYSKLIDDRPVNFKLAIRPPTPQQPLKVSLETDFNEKNLDIKLDSLQGVTTSGTFKGNINFHSKINYTKIYQEHRKNLTGNATLKIHNGNFEDPTQKLSIKGIELSFSLQELFKLKSKPSQKLSFKECSIQDFRINNAVCKFQTESPDSFFIEKVGFKWCSGNVAVNAFRIRASHPKDIDIILYCDRLNVTELLNQFKIGNASGDGTVSGKIPIMYNKRKLLIDNGFLYSTPGIGGNIALTDFLGPLTDMKSLFQIDIAEEALKNFNYHWLRIKLNSEKEELLLRLEMDGAPAGLLPFGFDFERGGFYRSDDPHTKAKFNGISFQINFRLPANRVLEYSRKFQELKK